VTFNALVLEKTGHAEVFFNVQELTEDRLPPGDVSIAVEYTTVNYKDGLCMQPNNGLVRNYPHVPGIDFAGTVQWSDDSRYKAGDKVVLTGWVTGRPETADYLKSLGAHWIVARQEIDTISKKPLEAETWAGCVDAVGGEMLARVIGQLKYGASVAAVGLAGGAALPTSVIPFLLRGVNLLGIDSVMQPYDQRLRAWQHLATDLPLKKLEAMIRPATLAEVPTLGAEILKGQIMGRIVVDVHA
jgi:NADPH:quinone reductase-like Zn-dependent oxidoreductase